MYMQTSTGTPNVLVTSTQSNYQTFSKQQENSKELTIAQSSEILHQSYMALCQQRGLEIDKILLYQNMKIREKNWVELDLEREIGVEMFKVVCEVMKINKFYLSFKAKGFEMNSTHFQIIDTLINHQNHIFYLTQQLERKIDRVLYEQLLFDNQCFLKFQFVNQEQIMQDSEIKTDKQPNRV